MQRVGRKNDPSYRVIVTESTSGPKSGKYVEQVGTYDPIRKKRVIKKDRVLEWIKNGAKVSDTVHNILVGENIIEGKKRNVLPKKTPILKEDKEKQSDESTPTAKVKDESTLNDSEKTSEIKDESTEESKSESSETDQKTETPQKGG